VKDVFEPTVDGKADGLYVSKGYDATSHFETSIDDVLEMYTKITNETLDLTNLPVEEEQDGQ
jgi:Rab GDP dissociation inhibitor